MKRKILSLILVFVMIMGIIPTFAEGENAKKIYDIIVNSHTYKEYPNSLKLDYKEGLLLIMENWWYRPLYADCVIPFLLGDDYYYMQHDDLDDEWETNDHERKYFTIPTHDEP